MKLTTLALTLLLTLPVFAADSVVFLIERTQTELGEGIKIIEQTQHDVDKAKEQLKPLERIFDKNKTQHDAIRKQLEDDITLYNQTCEGRPVSYNHCGTRQNAMRLEKTRKEKDLAAMEQLAHKLNPTIIALNSRITLGEFAIRKQTSNDRDLQATIDTLKANLSKTCSYTSPEAMKHNCGNIQFDGAPSALPPCTTPACLKWDAAHRGKQ